MRCQWQHLNSFLINNTIKTEKQKLIKKLFKICQSANFFVFCSSCFKCWYHLKKFILLERFGHKKVIFSNFIISVFPNMYVDFWFNRKTIIQKNLVDKISFHQPQGVFWSTLIFQIITNYSEKNILFYMFWVLNSRLLGNRKCSILNHS